jgi:hypothetical protein
LQRDGLLSKADAADRLQAFARQSDTLDPGSALAGKPAFTGFSHGYLSSRLNLASLAGQSVRFRFRIATDSSTGYQGWFIDEVWLYRCVAGSSAPTVNAGADKTVNSGAAFALPATGTHPEGKPLAYFWVKTAGPAATIKDPRERIASVAGINGGDSDQNLTFKVTDAQGLTATDTVNVHINPK